ncbi:MAG: hypothetical protein WD273_07835 [Trueperaceae bacterium]
MATDSNKPSATSGGTSTGKVAKEVAQEAGNTAKELGREAMDQARSTTSYVRDQARTSVEEGKHQVAHQVGGVAQAFHKSSEELRSQELGRLADQGEWLAGRIDELQHYLEERSAGELLNDVRGVARSQPGWFLGGMFVAGLMTARFLHSSDSHSGSSSRMNSGSDGGMSGSYAGSTSTGDPYRTGDTTSL